MRHYLNPVPETAFNSGYYELTAQNYEAMLDGGPAKTFDAESMLLGVLYRPDLVRLASDGPYKAQTADISPVSHYEYKGSEEMISPLLRSLAKTAFTSRNTSISRWEMQKIGYIDLAQATVSDEGAANLVENIYEIKADAPPAHMAPAQLMLINAMAAIEPDAAPRIRQVAKAIDSLSPLNFRVASLESKAYVEMMEEFPVETAGSHKLALAA